ncbi:MAG: SPFH domain-containing protein [Candidatus Pacebacteria bacterium]|jgi:regulator of protease activity HflC (stomatin/prohibitin superfamily)|nr:SPFH domain-containing protein [Candidatus Paceibacterota bacterium]
MLVEGIIWGLAIWFILRVVVTGLYVVEQNERAVKTVFGRAQRRGKSTLDDPELSGSLDAGERDRYNFPQLQVIRPGGPYFKWPWERVNKVSVATNLVSIAYDPENRMANNANTVLEAVTKDQLNINLKGQLRYTVSERNLYAFLFGVQNPIAHVMGYFISILRERIANFEAPKKAGVPGEAITTSLPGVYGISINDLRKNLGDLNMHMEQECKSSAARYGIALDAALITDIEPPQEVESALAAINTAHNQVSSEISLAQASADQRIVQSKKAVEIETLNAQAEVQLLEKMAAQLNEIKADNKKTLPAYLRNVRLSLLTKAKKVILETKKQ